MFKATIRRYESVEGNKFIELDIPQRVTITGKEDFFERAYEDVCMAIRGMRQMDAALGLDKDDTTIRYSIMRLEDC